MITGMIPPNDCPMAPSSAEATPALSLPASIAATLAVVDTMPTMSMSMKTMASYIQNPHPMTKAASIAAERITSPTVPNAIAMSLVLNKGIMAEAIAKVNALNPNTMLN